MKIKHIYPGSIANNARANILLAVIICFFTLQTNAQSAIRQLEEITGQKINVYQYGGNDYNYNYTPVNYPAEWKSFVTDMGHEENQNGIKYYAKGKYKKALRHFKRASKYLPDNQSIKNNIENAKREIAKSGKPNKPQKPKKEKTKPAKNEKEIKKVEKRIKELKDMISRDQQAIRNLGCSKTISEYENWLELSENAQTEVEYKTFGLLLEAVKYKSGLLSKLNDKRAKKYLNTMSKSELGVPFFMLEFLSDVENNAKDAKKVSQVCEVISKAMSANDIYGELKKEQWLELGWELIKLGTKDPRINFIAAELEAVSALLYRDAVYIYGTYTMDNLLSNTERQLKILTSLSERMKGHVKQLNEAKEELSKLK